jgi:hypothetical protein
MCDKQCPVKSYKDRLIAEQAEEIKRLNLIVADYQELIDKMMEQADEGEEQ